MTDDEHALVLVGFVKTHYPDALIAVEYADGVATLSAWARSTLAGLQRLYLGPCGLVHAQGDDLATLSARIEAKLDLVTRDRVEDAHIKVNAALKELSEARRIAAELRDVLSRLEKGDRE